eukprot:4484200-Pleurochrysis_carterae.AAC.1
MSRATLKTGLDGNKYRLQSTTIRICSHFHGPSHCPQKRPSVTAHACRALTEHAASKQDAAVDTCLSDIIACPDAPAIRMHTALHLARLPISMPVLGISSACDTRSAAYVASFLSCLPRVRHFFPYSFPPYLGSTLCMIKWHL